MSTSPSLLLVGCGKMGDALLTRWNETHAAGIAQFNVIDPEKFYPNTPGITLYKTLDALPRDHIPNVIVFAVKPQILPSVLSTYHKRFGNNPLYISIAAGKDLAFLSSHLGEHAHVIRAMPNLPATIGQGITALCTKPLLPPTKKNTATQLLEAVGKVVWIDDESHMDIVTAISGSGPAYVFLFLDVLVKAGVSAGLREEVAKTLAVQTVQGSAQLAGQSPETLEVLRQNVTSPGGTTAAALEVLLYENGFGNLLEKAVKAAEARSKELK